jgi:hypothetical protein
MAGRDRGKFVIDARAAPAHVAVIKRKSRGGSKAIKVRRNTAGAIDL